jgi:hypothetical protein
MPAVWHLAESCGSDLDGQICRRLLLIFITVDRGAPLDGVGRSVRDLQLQLFK